MSASYYGRPVLKAPVWTWEIPVYLFVGGTAGAAATFALVCEARGDDGGARRAWLVALAGVGVSPALLISDLGRPERFHHMLRVVKPTSPMNMGSWILSVSGAAFALGAARSVLGWFPRLGRARVAAALAGPALSTYTGVLVADTAIPVWHEAHRELPFVFAAGSAMSAGGALGVLGAGAPAARLAVMGAVGELAATTLMERRLGGLAEPYRGGDTGRFARAAKGLAVAGAALTVAGRRRSGGALLLGAAMATRWSIHRAGFAGAQDPKYVVEPQRERVRARATSGGSAR